MRLNTVFAGVAALGILSAAPAFAADLPPPVVAPAVIAEAPAFSWQGFYFGVGGGLAAGRMHYPWALTFTCPYQTDIATTNTVKECPSECIEGCTILDGEFELTASGFIAGPQIGFNIQRNSLVLGIVADINWSNYTGELSASIDEYYLALGSTVDWYGTLRARLGFAFGDQGRALAYITGGLAYGSTTHYYEFGDGIGPLGGDSVSFTNLGWAAGAGVEVAITDRLSFQTEYLYVDLGTNNLVDLDFWRVFNFSLDANTAFHTIKAGFNFRVGGN